MPEPAKCRSCGADVYFVPSAKTGKLMILDAEPSSDGNIEVTDEGKARVIRKDDLFTRKSEGGLLHLDHHVTCPSAKQWRKSKVKDS